MTEDRNPYFAEPSVQICIVDVDYAKYLGNEEDGVYYDVAKGPDGWYASAMVDCNSGNFCDSLLEDAGPFDTKAAAWAAGYDLALQWCADNDVDWEDAA